MKIKVIYNKLDTVVDYAYKLSKKHCGNYIVSDDLENYDVKLTLKVDNTIAAEAYKIELNTEGDVVVTGGDKLGLLYGIGRFFHKGFSLKSNEYSVPSKKIRGIYFATHFHNFYHDAPIEKVLDYAEELVFWGCNSILMWFDMHHFKGIDDPEAMNLIDRMKKIYAKAKEIGMKISLLMLSNEYYHGAPKELLATNSIKDNEYFAQPCGYFNTELCPSVSEAKDLLIASHMEVIDCFSEIGLDYICLFPYDQGGCTCVKCRPWGSNSFLKISKCIVDEIRKTNSHTKCILSGWRFDHFVKGEWNAILDNMSELAKDYQYIMADFESYVLPSNLHEVAQKYGVDLMGFPEISMSATPWGGFGATPQPEKVESCYNMREKMHQGGFAYSEGVFEDMNKAIILGLYFGNSTASETVKDYFRFYFSQDTVQYADGFVECLETLLPRIRISADGVAGDYSREEYVENLPTFKIRNTDKIARACELVELIKDKLPDKAREDFRFKMLYLRTVIDKALIENSGLISDKTERAARELEKIYGSYKADYVVSPIHEESIRNNRGHI